MTGIYSIAESIQRTVPTITNNVTHETIHPSVLKQKNVCAEVQKAIQANAALVCGLAPLEEVVRDNWRVRKSSGTETLKDEGHKDNVVHAAKEAVALAQKLGHGLLRKIDHHQVSTSATDEESHLGQTATHQLLEEHSMSAVFKDVLRSVNRH